MLRAAQERRVFFIEEPVFDAERAELHMESVAPNLTRIVPRLPAHEPPPESRVNELLLQLCEDYDVQTALHWYYTPMMLGVSAGLPCDFVVYDCMDELANFKFAPTELQARERELLSRADVVFTGGRALYEAKRSLHRNVHAMPSSVDVAHFRRARDVLPEPLDQAPLPRPRLGYCGVVDERMDLALIDGIAQRRPDWQIVMLGPVVKIDVAELPRRSNIHYLGLKTYDELPAYLSGWDVALLPFALNDATRYISPTKTPEYLAAGKPVVSAPIRDVIEPYGRMGIVHIATGEEAFVAAIEAALGRPDPGSEAQRDALLAEMSWDATWQRMLDQIQIALATRSPRTAAAEIVSDSHV
jgi:glycosyltransferase involved in cell wall biosynthesis